MGWIVKNRIGQDIPSRDIKKGMYVTTIGNPQRGVCLKIWRVHVESLLIICDQLEALKAALLADLTPETIH